MAGVFKTSLASKKALSGNVYSFVFSLTDPKEISFKAGQYVILRVQGKPRLYSIASPVTQKDTFELVIELVPGGLASEFLKAANTGDEIVFFGPAGQFMMRDTPKQKIFMVTGTGIAPVRSIIGSDQPNPGGKVHLFWGMKKFSDLYLLDELRNWKKSKQEIGIMKICLSREEGLGMVPEADRNLFDLGHVNDCLESELAAAGTTITDYEYYLCGGSHVVESLKDFLYGKGVPKEQVFYEKF